MLPLPNFRKSFGVNTPHLVKATSNRGAFLACQAEGLQPLAPAGFNCHLGTATVGTHYRYRYLFASLEPSTRRGFSATGTHSASGTIATGTYIASGTVATGTHSFNFATGTLCHFPQLWSYSATTCNRPGCSRLTAISLENMPYVSFRWHSGTQALYGRYGQRF